MEVRKRKTDDIYLISFGVTVLAVLLIESVFFCRWRSSASSLHDMMLLTAALNTTRPALQARAMVPFGIVPGDDSLPPCTFSWKHTRLTGCHVDGKKACGKIA